MSTHDVHEDGARASSPGLFRRNWRRTKRGLKKKAVRPSIAELERRLMLDASLPDLVVSSVSAPSSAVVGNNATISLSWTVTNQGANAVPADQFWTDTVYLSPTATYDPQTAVAVTGASRSTQYGIHAGGSYSETMSVALPVAPAGSEFLLFVANSNKSLDESDTTNDVKAQPITTLAPKVDLGIDKPNASATSAVAANGGNLSLSWTVTNHGTDPASATRSDSVYLSTKPTYDDSAIFLGSASSAQQPLAGGDSIDESTTGTIPNVSAGSYFLLFVADATHNQYDTNPSNNLVTLPLTITRPDVDLSLTTASAPATVSEGSSVTLSYSVKNLGTDAANAGWYDEVYASPTPTFDPKTAVYVGSGYPGTSDLPLAAGASYSVSQQYTIPAFPTGAGYLLFVANDGGSQAESGLAPGDRGSADANNVFAVATTFVAPELKATTVTAPSSAVLGASIGLSYTVKNVGGGDAGGSWVDYVYLSKTPTFDPDTAVYVASFPSFVSGPGNSSLAPLAAGASYTIDRPIALPTFATGDAYLIVVPASSYLSQSGEQSASDIASTPITISAPDLAVIGASAPATAVLGTDINVSFTVENQGTVAAPGIWSDTVYVSDVPFLDDTATEVQTFDASAESPLAPGANYTQFETLTLPQTAVGHRYLLFVSNASGAQGETNTKNNTVAVPIDLSAPDLTVTNLSAPASAILGDQFQVSYTVKNVGTVATATTWQDSFYLSDTPTFDPSTATFVTSVDVSAQNPLAPGASYTLTPTLQLPQTRVGARYLIVQTDPTGFFGEGGSSGQPETDTTNNTFAVPITLTAPDLATTDVTGPSTVTTGDTASISWTVKNVGTVAAPGEWTDIVYLSTTPDLSGQLTFVGTFDESSHSPLGAGASYTESRSVTIPNSAKPGQGYLVVVANYSRQQPESDTNGYSAGANNIRAIPITVAAPDLVVSNVTVPSTATLGNAQSFTVSYTVTNQGSVPALGSWSDGIYLSDSPTLDTSKAILVGLASAGSTPLDPLGSYTANQTITLPAGVAGTKYLFVVANYSQSQGETDFTNDAVSKTIAATQPSVDLGISSPTLASSVISNQTLPLAYTVTNSGTDSAQGTWSDTFYLSKGTTHTADDIFVGAESSYYYGPLVGGKSANVQTNITIPGSVAPGQYNLLIVVNGNGTQGETDGGKGANNVAVVPITIASPDLTVTSLTVPSDVKVDDSYTITWTVKNVGGVEAPGSWSDDVYLSSTPDYQPAHATYLGGAYHSNFGTSPLAPGDSYTASTTVTIPNSAPPGAQYILIVANDGSSQGETDKTNNVLSQPTTVTVPDADLAVTTATAPDSAVLGQSMTISWTVINQGDASANGTWSDAVYLSDGPGLDGNSTYLGTFDESANSGLAAGASYVESRSIYLPQSAVGKRYVVIVTNSGKTQHETNPDDDTFALPITLDAPDLVVTAANAPASFAPGDTITVSWTVTNQGDVATTADWLDAVYISDGTTFDSGHDTFLTEAEINAPTTPLAPGASYTITQQVVVPATVEGSRHLVFVVNSTHSQPESNLGNDTFALPAQVGTSDLAASGIIASSQALFGQTLDVSWVDKNLGNNSISLPWSDSIYLSSSTSIDSSAVLLATVSSDGVGTLDGGASANRGAKVTLPLGINSKAGSFFIIVRADALNQVPESNENNNNTSRAIALTLPALPNLVATALTVPASGQTGQSFLFSWTDINKGDADATTAWTDTVYASLDGTLDHAVKLGSFANPGPLAKGDSLDRTVSLVAPGTPGSYTLIVVTNDGNGVVEGPNASDDTTPSTSKIVVTLTQLPDLVVTSITPPPDGALSGQSVPVTFTVKNEGNVATQVPVWHDFVILSQDPTLTFDGGTDQTLNNQPVLAQFDNPSYLDAGGSYQQTVDVRLPIDATGTWYVYIVANGLGSHYFYTLPESDRTNNLRVSAGFDVQLAPPPDLAVTNVAAPLQAFSGQPTTVGWTVSNVGTGPTFASSWSDEVYLSPTPTFDPATAVSLGTFAHNGAVAAGGRYTQSATVDLPIGVSGPFYFIVQADQARQVFQDGLTANDIAAQASPTTINLTPPPDLEIDSATSTQSSVLAGHDLAVSYTVTNAGSTATPNGSWTDTIYLSTQATFDPARSTVLADETHFGVLDAGASYSNTYNVKIPDGLNGTYYVFVRSDSNNVVFEVDKSNNIKGLATPLDVTYKPVDLAVSSVTPPAQAAAGTVVNVTWTVENQGVGDTVAAVWSDQVYASINEDLSGPVLLGTFDHIGNLAGGGSYTTTRPVMIPVTFQGTYFLFVATNPVVKDPSTNALINAVYESDYTNDTSAAVPVDVVQSLADLQVSKVTAPTTLATGTTAFITWTTTNAGVGTTSASSWYDDVWLSTKPDVGQGGDDIYVGSYYNVNALAPGESYVGSATVSLPQDMAAGTYYVIVRADRPAQVAVPNNFNASTVNRVYESDETNNDAASAPVAVTAGPAADLAVSGVSAPADAVTGQPLAVTWTVTNVDAATGNQPWYDAVYLSLDTVFDRQSDIYLGYVDHNGGLAAGASYTQTSAFKIPAGLSGSYHAFVVTDGNNTVFERGRSANDVGISGATVSVSAPPPVDLVAGTITIPANASPGDDITFSYTVTNQSGNNAIGQWTDSLYLSADGTFAFTDPLLAQSLHKGGLAAGSSYTATLTAPVPGVAPGTYYVILRTDVLNQIPETDETNNIGVSLTQASVDAKALTLGTPQSGSLDEGRSAYYKVDVAAGQTLQVAFKSQVPGSVNELYVSYGAMPSRGQYDFTDQSLTADGQVTVPTTQAGTYYILVYGSSVPGGPESDTITASLVPFSVSGVAPGQVGNAGPSTIEIDGARFDRGTTFQLVAPGGAVVSATATVLQDASTAFATFDLTGLPVGHYTVQATSSGGTVFKLSDALDVVPGLGADIDVEVNVPPITLAGRISQFIITVTNRGDSDAAAPWLTVTSPTGTPYGFSPDHLQATYPLKFLALSPTGTAGVIRPGQQFTIAVDFISSTTVGAPYEFLVTPVTTDDRTPLDLSQVLGVISSQYQQAPGFAAAWAAVQQDVGTTYGSYVAFLDRQASLLPPTVLMSGQATNTQEGELLDLDIRRAFASLGTSLSGSVVSSDPSLKVVGDTVYATDRSTGQSYSTQVLQDGRFIFDRILPGDYTLSFPDAVIASSSTSGTTLPPVVSVADGQVVIGVTLDVERGGSIIGSVVAQGSQAPIAGARVIAVDPSGHQAFTTTDASGHYALPGLVGGTYTLYADADGYARQSLGGVLVTFGQASSANIAVSHEATIMGTVILGAGGPSSGSGMVSAVLEGATGPGRVYTAALPAGVSTGFTLIGLPAGTYDLTISLPGYVTTAVAGVVVAAGAEVPIAPVELQAASDVSGTVTSTNPQIPVAGLALAAYQGTTFVTAITADIAGHFNFTGLAPGTYSIQPLDDFDFVTPVTVTVTAGQSLANVSAQVPPGDQTQGPIQTFAMLSPAAKAAPTPPPFYVAPLTAPLNPAAGWTNSQFEPSIAVNPRNPNQIFLVGANEGTIENTGGLFTAYSTDGGATWTQRLIASGPGGDGLPLGSNNVKVAFDDAGNLYLVYLELGTYAVDLLRTSDPSQPWSTANLIYKTIHGIDASASATFDYPGLAVGPDSIWIAYKGPQGIEATGASLDNGVVGTFRDPVIVDPDGNYPTIAMGPDGHVVVADLNGSSHIVAANIDPNAPPGTAFAISDAAAPNVMGGAFDIPAQDQIDTLPGLAWDTSARFGSQGRLYLAYTDSPDPDSTATFVVVISSDDGGATWSNPVRVTPVKQANSSQFYPSIAVDQSTGNVAVSWYDTSIDPSDHALTQVDVAVSRDGGQHFTTGMASPGVSDPNWGQLDNRSRAVQYGDWAGLAYVNGVVYPAWVEDSKPGGGFTGQFNLNIAKVGIQGLSTFPTVQGQAWFQAIIDDTFAHFIIPPLPDDENCDDCDYQDVLDAEQEAIDAARDAVFAAGTLVADARQAQSAFLKETAEFIKDLRDLETTAFAAANVAVASLGSDADAAEQLKKLVEMVDELGQAIINVEEDDDPDQLSDDLDHLNDVTANLVTFADNLADTWYQEMVTVGTSDPSTMGDLIAAFKTAIAALSPSPYADLAGEIDELQSDIDDFLDKGEEAFDAIDEYVDAIQEYEDCVDANCGGGGGVGPPHNGGRRGGGRSGSPHDPNQIIGPAGYGDAGFVAKDATLPYTIDFANEATATLPAQQVVITDQLDPNLDGRSFRLGNFGFGGKTYQVPANSAFYQTRIDLEARYGFDVDVTATIDVRTGVATWTFTTIDPATGAIPSDPSIGFLPADNDAGIGEGFVSYTVLAGSSAPTGTVIGAQARIVFDTQEPIDTPRITNTLDAGGATSTVAPLPASTPDTDIPISWAGTAEPGSSGVGTFNVYVSEDGGPFTPFLIDTTATSATFTGVPGHTYSFFSVASDNVGQRQPRPSDAQATVTVTAPQLTEVTSISASGTFGGPGDVTATLTMGGAPLAGKEITFLLDADGISRPLGTATTDDNGVATLSGVSLDGIDAGTYADAIRATFAGDNVGLANSATGPLDVAQAPATLSLSDLDYTYDGSPHGATVTTAPGDLGGVVLTYTQNGTTVAAPTTVGSYTVTASLDNPNYSAASVLGTLVIDQATPTIAWDTPDDITYGTALGAAQLDATASIPGTFSYSVAAGTVLHAGQGQLLSVTFTPTDTVDYSPTTDAVQINVTTAALVVTTHDGSKAYGQANPAFSVTYDGFVNGETEAVLGGTLGFSTSATAASPVGSYLVTPSGLTSTDYTISYVDGKLTVTPATLTITADGKSKVYGQANPSLTASYSGFVNGDTTTSLTKSPVLSTTATNTSHVGPYAINVSGAEAANYTITYVAGNLSVTPASLTITANDKAKVYGQANPTLTASYSGFVNGDTATSLTKAPVLATTATTASHVGSDAINASGAFSSDYTITYVAGKLAITPATLTITADDKTKVAGQPNPPLTATYSGFVNGDTAASLSRPVVLSTSATAGSGAGSYAIVASGATSSDYTIKFADGQLTVTAAPVTPPTSPPIIKGTTAAVMILYRELLGRDPEPAGLRYWLKQLALESPRRLLRQIAASPEAIEYRRGSRGATIRPEVVLRDVLRAERLGISEIVIPPSGPDTLFPKARARK